mgnify:CR=1 FL=1
MILIQKSLKKLKQVNIEESRLLSYRSITFIFYSPVVTPLLVCPPKVPHPIPPPPSPRGYEIYDDGKCVEKCMAGHGSFLIRAILKTKKLDNGETVIDVTGFPEMVTMDDTIREIGKLIAAKEIYGIQDISDESDLGHANYHIH